MSYARALERKRLKTLQQFSELPVYLQLPTAQAVLTAAISCAPEPDQTIAAKAETLFQAASENLTRILDERATPQDRQKLKVLMNRVIGFNSEENPFHIQFMINLGSQMVCTSKAEDSVPVLVIRSAAPPPELFARAIPGEGGLLNLDAVKPAAGSLSFLPEGDLKPPGLR